MGSGLFRDEGKELQVWKYLDSTANLMAGGEFSLHFYGIFVDTLKPGMR